MKKVRIGIIGGTFDPIHIGHLIIAQNAVTQYHLDQILFIPTGHSPHKDDKEIEQSAHRLEMIRLSIKNNPDFYFDISFCLLQQRPAYDCALLEEILYAELTSLQQDQNSEICSLAYGVSRSVIASSS